MPRASGLLLRHAGFGLVEIMVSVVIGMLAILVMMQQLSIFEQNKRTTTGGADAQNNGAIALYGLQRDIRQSGYGFVIWANPPNPPYPPFSCSVGLLSGGTVPVVPVVINPATSIIPAGDANTDTLLVFYGNTNQQPQGTEITAQLGLDSYVAPSSTFAVGDIVMAAPDSCAGTLLARPVTAVGATTITSATGAGTAMYNLGRTPSVLAYAIRDGNLTMCDYMATNCGVAKASVTAAVWAATWVSIANNVVSMRAQYGVDTSSPMDAVVDTFNQTTPTTNCGWAKVSALRLALVARNTEYNKTEPDGTNVTSAAPTWDGSAGAPIVLSGNPEWNHYRYKVFQTVVPMRNMAWMGVQSGC
ncbi:MAG: PilW family protein [Betaproteobacteria bacterium]|nr:PilW family protein [Betaproteobacteria bacterium]